MGAKYYLKTWWRMVKIYTKMDVLWFLRDTKVCLMYMFSEAVMSLSGVVGMVLLADRLGTATGMGRPELMFMLGCGLLVNGLFNIMFINNNTGAISRVIGRGQLDHALIQPVPLPLHFATSGFGPLTGLGPMLTGLPFALWAAGGVPGGYGMLLRLIPLLLLALVIQTAWVYGVSALAFWAPYAAEEIAPDVTETFTSLQSYPLTALSRTAQFALCGVVPVGAMGWLPTVTVLENAPAGAGFMAAVAAVAAFLATAIFRKGLKHYAKYSSPRYSGFGR